MKEYPNSILTGKPLKTMFSLGSLYVSDFIAPGNAIRSPKEPLEVGMDEETGLVQLTSQPESKFMWGDIYWYKSGTNKFMCDALANVVSESCKFLKTENQDVWLDIASNDGTLLSHVPNTFYKVGIDPSSYTEAEEKANLILKEYFSADVYFERVKKQAKIVTCCAMFYDLSDPISFLKNVGAVLRDDGIFVLQLSYTPLMIIQKELGNVCHEHIAYYTLKSLEYTLAAGGFKVMDVELNNVNGGSLRAYCSKSNAELSFKTRADRDIASIRIDSLRAFELKNGYNTSEKYLEFFDNMVREKEKFLNFLRAERKLGKIFWGYGASTKGNTIIQWFELTDKDINGIAERQSRKFGLKCVGSNIPIFSEDDARLSKPDYMIVFPWHFISEFKSREKEYLRLGGKLIVLSPNFEVISHED